MKAGAETHWTNFGSGPRPALLIHCSLAHGGSWAGVARRLSDRLRMVAFDLPGHGRSADRLLLLLTNLCDHPKNLTKRRCAFDVRLMCV